MGDSCLIPVDRKLANSVKFLIFGEDQIEFQFPPKIITEQNSSSWLEKEIWSIELLRIHRGSIGRRLNMEWEYVATDKKFTPAFIAEQLRVLKEYFFIFEGIKAYPVVKVQYGQIIPDLMNFRLRDVNISYSREIMNDGTPLHSKVNVTLELATKLNVADEDQAGLSDRAKAKIDQKPLTPVKKTWY
jgi:hypothetical protein